MVVDDHAAVREGIEALLHAESDIDPIATAATAREAGMAVHRGAPQVVVLDYHLPDENGLSLCLRLKSAERVPAVLIYSAFVDEQLAPLAIVAGADAVISKIAGTDVLCETIRALARGRRCLPTITPMAMGSVARHLETADLPILGMLAHGMSETEIADTLRMDETWLAARRWAILKRLVGESVRRRPPRAAPAW